MSHKYLTAAIMAVTLLLVGRTNLAAQTTNVAPQNLRQSIGVVLNEPEEELAKQLRAYGLYFSRMGIRTASRSLTQLARPSFGSGVVVELDGMPYLLTNSHVVGVSDKVNVLFIQDKDTLRLDDCTCIYNDAVRDIAIVNIPRHERLVPLPMETTPLTEGTTVYSAGYPGLGGAPSWQFGQGIVSNARLELTDAPFTYIQHTAQVDKGSSGSPLLVRDGEQYKIAGISTMKASNREAVGIAIPAQKLLDAFSLVGDDNTADWRKALDTLSVEDYDYMYQRVPDSILNAQDSLFYRGEVLRAFAIVPDYAASNQLDKKSKNRNDYTTAKRYEAARQAADNKDTNTQKDATGKSTASSGSSGKRSKEYGINEDLDFIRFIQANAVLFAPFPTSFQAGLGFRNAFLNYGRVGLDISYGSLPKEWLETTQNVHALDFVIVFGVQVPVNLGPVVLIPYLTPDVGVSMQFDKGVGAAFGGHVGTDIGYPFSDVMLYLGVDYTLLGNYNFIAKKGLKVGHGIGLHLGIAF